MSLISWRRRECDSASRALPWLTQSTEEKVELDQELRSFRYLIRSFWAHASIKALCVFLLDLRPLMRREAFEEEK